MAVQKRRQSKARKNQRRAQWMRSVPVVKPIPCPKCSEPKLPHRVCEACGHYKDREVLKVGEESEG
jgi:large subunit ribosomal protein L32